MTQPVTLTPANVAHGIWNVLAEDSTHTQEYVFPSSVDKPWELPMAVEVEAPQSGDTCFTVTVRRTERVEGTDEFPFPHDKEMEVLQTFHVTVAEVTT